MQPGAQDAGAWLGTGPPRLILGPPKAEVWARELGGSLPWTCTADLGARQAYCVCASAQRSYPEGSWLKRAPAVAAVCLVYPRVTPVSVAAEAGRSASSTCRPASALVAMQRLLTWSPPSPVVLHGSGRTFEAYQQEPAGL